LDRKGVVDDILLNDSVVAIELVVVVGVSSVEESGVDMVAEDAVEEDEYDGGQLWGDIRVETSSTMKD
jgi:hypothetical protein